MFQPFSDRILVRPADEASSQPKAGGLTIPDAAKEKPREGTVLAVGPGFLSESGIRTPLQCAEGDIICYEKHAGKEITLDGEKLLILHESELLGKRL